MESRVSPRRILRPLIPLVAPLGAALLFGTTGMFSAASAQTPQPKAPDTIESRVQGCTACHGSHGQGTDNDYFPRLAGKPAEYLYNQLMNFRDGRRKYPPMNYLVTYLSDEYLHEIATYFSQQRPPYPPPAKPNVGDSVHADYMSAQIGAWRSGSRHAKAPDCMHEIATRLTDDDVNAVAAWLSTQNAPQNPVPAAAGSLKTPLACGSEPQ
jgi:cytochrome c553